MKLNIRAFFESRLFLVKMAADLVARISQWQYSRFILLRFWGKLCSIPLYYVLKEDYYRLLVFSKKSKFVQKRKSRKTFSQYKPSLILIRSITDKNFTATDYLKVLEKEHLSTDLQFSWAQRLMGIGRLDLAQMGFLDLTRQKTQISSVLRLQAHRYMGIVSFLLGENNKANYHWRLAGGLRRILFKPTTPRKYRILGSSWFIAIGHIAMLDYYLKFRQLYAEKGARIVAQWPIQQSPGRELINKISGQTNNNLSGQQLMNSFSQLGIEIIPPDKLEQDYNRWAEQNEAPQWSELDEEDKMAMTDDFWEYDFPDNHEVLGYAHAASRIQREWEKADLESLFVLSEADREWIADYLLILGLPRNAWYVCLHVREGGFHQEWNALYPSMRDANIADYNQAIEKIVNAGGWVLRMGDASMKPLPPMHHVVDYAHSTLKSATADILLAAGCRFFLGTNSGYATICSIYNVPCALSNWVPLGWPLWPKQDLMIPKLFRDKTSGEYLNLEQVFDCGLAFIQNSKELPEDIELVSNTPEDLAQLTLEMLSFCKINHEQPYIKAGAPASIEAYYRRIAKNYGAFSGSRLARTFVEKHAEIFSPPKDEAQSTETTRGNEITWQEQSKDSMTATLN